MNRNSILRVSGILILCAVTSLAQAPAANSAKGGYFTSAQPLDLLPIVTPPPPQNSETVKAELAELHQIEKTRTPAQVAAAQADSNQENMFYLHTVLGDQFRPENLPLTAALSDHIHSEEAAASDVLKAYYNRSRPYAFDPTLHSECGTTTQASYPSGHSIAGYLEAFALAEMVPEKRNEILARADDFAHNRLVCGVHYPSDIATGRQVAYATVGYLMANPKFQSDLAGARAEVRKLLGLK